MCEPPDFVPSCSVCISVQISNDHPTFKATFSHFADFCLSFHLGVSSLITGVRATMFVVMLMMMRKMFMVVALIVGMLFMVVVIMIRLEGRKLFFNAHLTMMVMSG